MKNSTSRRTLVYVTFVMGAALLSGCTQDRCPEENTYVDSTCPAYIEETVILERPIAVEPISQSMPGNELRAVPAKPVAPAPVVKPMAAPTDVKKKPEPPVVQTIKITAEPAVKPVPEKVTVATPPVEKIIIPPTLESPQETVEKVDLDAQRKAEIAAAEAEKAKLQAELDRLNAEKARISAEKDAAEKEKLVQKKSCQPDCDEVKDWVASEGATLRGLLAEWGDVSGWRVVWNMDRDYTLEAGAVFRGRFVDVSSALLRSFARARPAPKGVFYKGNKVLVIGTQEDENAE